MNPTLRPAGHLGEVFQDVFVRMRQRGHPLDGDLLPYPRAAVVNSCRSALRGRQTVIAGSIT